MADEIDTFNKFMVGVQGDMVRILRPVPPSLSKGDALILAAWLVALADDDGKFSALLDAVHNT